MKFIAEPSLARKEEAVAGSREQASGAMLRIMERGDWNKRYAAEEFIWTVNANRFLMAEAASLAPGSALDLAAGEGRNAVWLAEQGWTVRAVDFSNVAVEKGKRLAAARNVSDKINFIASSVKSVGELRFGQLSKCMIQR